VWFVKSVRIGFSPPDEDQPPVQKSRRKHRSRGFNIKKGNLSLLMQVAIIFAAIGIATLGLLAIMGRLSQPIHSEPAPYESADP
jgi:hypothetical protein